MTRNTGIRREAFERCDWQAVIDAHPHESHAPQEWLDYSIALQQRLIPGPDATKQRQQIELAIMQAQNEGASAAAVAAALLDPVLLSLHEALAAVWDGVYSQESARTPAAASRLGANTHQGR